MEKNSSRLTKLLFLTFLLMSAVPVLAGCTALSKKSELYSLLLEKTGEPRFELDRVNLLFERGSLTGGHFGKADQEIQNLVADGFYLSISRLDSSNLGVVRCGQYSLSLGGRNVVLINNATVFRHNEFRVYLTVDSSCSIENA